MNVLIVLLVILIVTISSSNCFTITSVNNNAKNGKKYLQMSDKDIDDGKTNPTFGFLGGLGVAGNFCLDYSLYVLKTTGCNILPSPKYGEDTLFAEQAVSLVVVLGLFIYSVITKKETGRGLPPGPAGLLGAAEGLTYLTVLLAVVFVPWQLIGTFYHLLHLFFKLILIYIQILEL